MLISSTFRVTPRVWGRPRPSATAGILICMLDKCPCFLCMPWCEKKGNTLLDHWFSVCTVMWIQITWRFIKTQVWIQYFRMGVEEFLAFWLLLMLVQGSHLELWKSGDCICSSKMLVFIRITWGMWSKCCFLGSNPWRFYVTVVGWSPGICIFMSAQVINHYAGGQLSGLWETLL